jgi:hypothetical protein
MKTIEKYVTFFYFLGQVVSNCKYLKMKNILLSLGEGRGEVADLNPKAIKRSGPYLSFYC